MRDRLADADVSVVVGGGGRGGSLWHHKSGSTDLLPGKEAGSFGEDLPKWSNKLATSWNLPGDRRLCGTDVSRHRWRRRRQSSRP